MDSPSHKSSNMHRGSLQISFYYQCYSQVNGLHIDAMVEAEDGRESRDGIILVQPGVEHREFPIQITMSRLLPPMA
jgi:hypothetical protein